MAPLEDPRDADMGFLAPLVGMETPTDADDGEAPSPHPARPVGPYPGTHSDLLVERMLETLTAQQAAMLRAHLAHFADLLSRDGCADEVGLGTLCSGTDLIVPVFEQLLGRLSQLLGRPLRVRHKFSCELCPKKRKWIAANFAPEILFGDIRCMGQHRAWDWVSESEVAIPRVHIVYAGFSCRSVSGLNVHRGDFADCVHEASGSTGITCEGVLAYLRQHAPSLAFLENVGGLISAGGGVSANLVAIQTAAAKLGYVCMHWS